MSDQWLGIMFVALLGFGLLMGARHDWVCMKEEQRAGRHHKKRRINKN